MNYRLMVIDDRRSRLPKYETVLSTPEFDPIYVWTPQELERHRDTPVDGYLIDAFLDGDWNSANAASVLKNELASVPRPAPVFLVSQRWNDTRVLDILKTGRRMLGQDHPIPGVE